MHAAQRAQDEYTQAMIDRAASEPQRGFFKWLMNRGEDDDDGEPDPDNGQTWGDFTTGDPTPPPLGPPPAPPPPQPTAMSGRWGPAAPDTSLVADDDEVQFAGGRANNNTDMAYWREQSARDMKAQLNIRYPRQRGNRGFKSRQDIITDIERLTRGGRWARKSG